MIVIYNKGGLFLGLGGAGLAVATVALTRSLTLGVILAAGGSLQWYRNHLGGAETMVAQALGIDPYEVLSQEAAQAPLGSEGLFFLPYLTGERTPHCDPFARGSWVGLSLRHGRSHLARAVMEGATFAMRDCLRIIRDMRIPISEIRLSGGGVFALSGVRPFGDSGRRENVLGFGGAAGFGVVRESGWRESERRCIGPAACMARACPMATAVVPLASRALPVKSTGTATPATTRPNATETAFAN